MHAAPDAGERDIVMQMGRRRDHRRIDAEIEQRVGVVAHRAGEDLAQQFAVRRARVGDADHLDAGQVGQHPGMIAAHDANPDHAQPHRLARVVLRGRTHLILHPQNNIPFRGRRASRPGPNHRETL
jgi:hypothetical protein